VLQGVLIGIACFAATVIASLLVFFIDAFIPQFSESGFRMSFYNLLDAAIAGLIGAALPPLLAKKGLYLGPFVTPGQDAKGQGSSGTEGTV
jgi:hypothetical protein